MGCRAVWLVCLLVYSRVSNFDFAVIAVAIFVFTFTLCACAGAKAWEMYAEVKKSTESLPYELVSWWLGNTAQWRWLWKPLSWRLNFEKLGIFLTTFNYRPSSGSTLIKSNSIVMQPSSVIIHSGSKFITLYSFSWTQRHTKNPHTTLTASWFADGDNAKRKTMAWHVWWRHRGGRLSSQYFRGWS